MTRRALALVRRIGVVSGLCVCLTSCSSVRPSEDRFHNLPYPFTTQFECDVSPSAPDTTGVVTVTVVEAPSWPNGTASLQHWVNGQPQLTTIALGAPTTLGRGTPVDSVRVWSAESDTVRGAVPQKAGCNTRVRIVLTTRVARE
jgi:hypothetical protein